MPGRRAAAEIRTGHPGWIGRLVSYLFMVLVFGVFLVVGAFAAGAFVVSFLFTAVRLVLLSRSARTRNTDTRPVGRTLDAEYQVLTPDGRVPAADSKGDHEVRY